MCGLIDDMTFLTPKVTSPKEGENSKIKYLIHISIGDAESKLDVKKGGRAEGGHFR